MELRKQAKLAGVSNFRNLNREELEAALKGGRKTKKAAPVKKAKPSKPARKPAAKSAAKKPAPKKAPAAKTAKRPASGDGGRNMIEGVDYNQTEGWNPRPGSPVDLIFRALKKARGNIDKTVDALTPDIRTFVRLRKENGEKRSKADQVAFLRWRVQRTKFDFVTKTGQHAPSANRVKYGEGGSGTGAFKRKSDKPAKAPAKRKPAAKKPAAKKPAAKRKK
jgi:hypothetical protein